MAPAWGLLAGLMLIACILRLTRAVVTGCTTLGPQAIALNTQPRLYWCVLIADGALLTVIVGLVASAVAPETSVNQ